MAKSHEIYIQNYLSKHTSESFISTELIDILLQQFPTLTANNCRKIINNALGHNMISSSSYNGSVVKTKFLTFYNELTYMLRGKEKPTLLASD
jgi:hypothetical protein